MREIRRAGLSPRHSKTRSDLTRVAMPVFLAHWMRTPDSLQMPKGSAMGKNSWPATLIESHTYLTTGPRFPDFYLT